MLFKGPIQGVSLNFVIITNFITSFSNFIIILNSIIIDYFVIILNSINIDYFVIINFIDQVKIIIDIMDFGFIIIVYFTVIIDFIIVIVDFLITMTYNLNNLLYQYNLG